MSRRAAVRTLSAVAAAAGLLRLVRRRRRRRADHRVYLLEYHDVTNGDEREGVVGADRLARHLRWLARAGYRPVPLADAIAALAAGRSPLIEDLVSITFDDGYAGVRRAALPVLQAAGAASAATVFVTTGFLDGEPLWFDVARRALAAARRDATATPEPVRARLAEALGGWPPRAGDEAVMRRLKDLPAAQRHSVVADLAAAELPLAAAAEPLSWKGVDELLAAGVEIGAHTSTHPILATLDADDQRHEIVASRDRLARETGTAPRFFAYPNGGRRDFDERSVAAVRAAGFEAALTTVRGSNRPGCDPFTLLRHGVGSDPSPVLAARLAGLFDEPMRALLERR